MGRKRGRGRPVLYVGNQAKHIAGLAKRYGAQKAQRILNANLKARGVEEREMAGLRNLKLVPDALGISLPTIYKLAAANGVEFKLGRRAA